MHHTHVTGIDLPVIDMQWNICYSTTTTPVCPLPRNSVMLLPLIKFLCSRSTKANISKGSVHSRAQQHATDMDKKKKKKWVETRLHLVLPHRQTLAKKSIIYCQQTTMISAISTPCCKIFLGLRDLCFASPWSPLGSHWSQNMFPLLPPHIALQPILLP